MYFLREEIKEKNNLLKLIMKSQTSIKQESKPGNYQNLFTVNKNSLRPLTTDINPGSNTETNKNISSEQSNATSRSNHDIEHAKAANHRKPLQN